MPPTGRVAGRWVAWKEFTVLRVSRVVSILVIASVLGLSGVWSATAQEVAAPVFPVTPDGSACQVAPRTADEIAAIFTARLETGATPEPETPPTSVEVTVGQPADPATVAGVTATLYEIVSCFNAGDFLRAMALFTDEGLLHMFSWVATEEQIAETRQMLEVAPVAVAEADRQSLIAVADVSRLADGRVGAFLVINDPPYPPDGLEAIHVVVTLDGDRWRVAEIAEFNVV